MMEQAREGMVPQREEDWAPAEGGLCLTEGSRMDVAAVSDEVAVLGGVSGWDTHPPITGTTLNPNR